MKRIVFFILIGVSIHTKVVAQEFVDNIIFDAKTMLQQPIFEYSMPQLRLDYIDPSLLQDFKYLNKWSSLFLSDKKGFNTSTISRYSSMKFTPYSNSLLHNPIELIGQSYQLNSGAKISLYGQYDANGNKRVQNVLPWEKNNFNAAFEFTSPNGKFGLRIEVSRERNSMFPY